MRSPQQGKESRRFLVPISNGVVTPYLLVDRLAERGVLIDGGFPRSSVARIETSLRHEGIDGDQVDAILLTHGHLDHTLNAKELRRLSGAPLMVPERDRDHVAGCHPYRGLARMCGIAEWLGRNLLGYESPPVDRWLEQEELLPFWGGLRVISLPGHTRGHCGFFSEEQDLLVAGDLFSNYLRFAKIPPPWFNVDTAEIRKSLVRADDLLSEKGRVILNHGNTWNWFRNRGDLANLARRCRRE